MAGELTSYWLARGRGVVRGGVLSPPAPEIAFLKDAFGVSVYKNGGVITHDYDDQKSKPAVTGSVYYVKPGGSHASAGTSRATAFALSLIHI